MFRFRRFFFVSSATIFAGFSMLAPGRAWASPDPTEPTTTVQAASPSASVSTICLASPPFVEFGLSLVNPTNDWVTFSIDLSDESGVHSTTQNVPAGDTHYIVRYPLNDNGSSVTVTVNGVQLASHAASPGECGPAPIDPASATITPMCGPDGRPFYFIDIHNPTPYVVVFTMTLVDQAGPDSYTMSVPAGVDTDFQYGTSYDSGSTMAVEVAGIVIATASHAAGDCAPAPETTTGPPTTEPVDTTSGEDPPTTTPTSEPPTSEPPTSDPVTMHEEPNGEPSATTSMPATDVPNATTPDTGGTLAVLPEQPGEPHHLPETGSSSVVITAIATTATLAGLVLRIVASRR